MLAYLLAHRERVVPKQESSTAVAGPVCRGRGPESLSEALRQALGERGRAPRFVRTLHGQGYRFVAPVEVREPLPADDVLLLPLPTAGTAAAPRGGLRGRAERSATARAPSQYPGRGTQTGHRAVGALAEAPPGGAPGAGGDVPPDARRAGARPGHVQRYGGTLLQVSGDGFLALFGAPVAQEDHARRAVLAALELRQRCMAPRRSGGSRMASRSAWGCTRGRWWSAPWGMTRSGPTRRWATRFPGHAAPAPGRARYRPRSAATYALVQAEVQGEAWGAARATHVHPGGGVCGARPPAAAGGVPQRGGRPLSPLVGRARELALLHERLAVAASGQGQAVGLVGEPGMGKSRLLAEFAHRLAGQPVTYCEGHCLAYGAPPRTAGARPAAAALGPARHGPPGSRHRHHPAAAARSWDRL